jgi:hypothetical protein
MSIIILCGRGPEAETLSQAREWTNHNRDLDDNGVLPHGIWRCTLEEVRNRFGNFQRTDRRPFLYKSLQSYIAELRSTGLAIAIIIDGSFVTGKPDPDDIDLILVLPYDWDAAGELRPSEYRVLSKRLVRRRHGFDIIAAREGSAAYGEALKFFEQVRGRSDWRKGLLRIEL